MKTVLCYGDSNTYGYNPSDGLRYPKDIRWTGRLQKLLGSEYNVIEEGCNGRTTCFDDPKEPWKNGLPYLRPCLNTHKPVDIVILMLGSNDLKTFFHASAKEIADGAATLIDVIREFTQEKQGFVPRIILVSPPEIGEGITSSPFCDHFKEDAITRSREFETYFGAVAQDKACEIFYSARYLQASKEDSLHLSPEAHKIMAKQLVKIIRNVDNIILIGMPTSGKSTVGVIAAKILGMDFLDTDIVIQKREGSKLSEIIANKGVDAFIECEEQALLSLDVHGTVIATGGSAVYSKAGMKQLAAGSRIVYLQVEKEEWYRRLDDVRERGVVLRDGETMDQMYDARAKLYEEYADVTVSEKGSTLEDTVRKVLDAVKE